MPKDPSFVTFPNLIVLEKEGRVFVKNLIFNSDIAASPSLLSVLKELKKPMSKKKIIDEIGIDEKTLDQLEKNHLIVNEDLMPFIEVGLVKGASPKIGKSLAMEDLTKKEKSGNSDFVIVGAPVDVASGGDGGSRHGPSEVRKAFPQVLDDGDSEKSEEDENPFDDVSTKLNDIEFRRVYDLASLNVHDLGNVVYSLGEGLEAFGKRLEYVLAQVIGANRTPILIGGDHSVSWFSLKPLLEKYDEIGIIHFDAHHDLYPALRGDLNHSNAFTHALKSKNLKYLRQIGLRTIEQPRAHTKVQSDRRISWVSAMELRSRSIEDVFKDLPTDTPCYLSFDVDCMSPSLVKETGTRVAGGLDYYQALSMIDHISQRFHFVGADFVEVSGPIGRGNAAASVVANCLLRFLLGSLQYEPLESYYFDYGTSLLD